VLRTRVIPCLLVRKGGLVKTVRFSEPKYVGDPINALRIFNEKEVDELILLDIEASREGVEPNYQLIEDVASEAFMPVTYGGGVTTVDQAQRIVGLGVEKIVINTAALHNPPLVRQLAERMGFCSTVVAIDVKRDWLGRYRVYDASRKKITEKDPVTHAREMAESGAGELFVNDANRDGTGTGFDLDLISYVTAAVNVPVIVCGGAGKLDDFRRAADAGASGVAAGSMFVYIGKHRAVMITYPPHKTLSEILT
jgi:imidazole glycerol-phosphate synthase subunit HisF